MARTIDLTRRASHGKHVTDQAGLLLDETLIAALAGIDPDGDLAVIDVDADHVIVMSREAVRGYPSFAPIVEAMGHVPRPPGMLLAIVVRGTASAQAEACIRFIDLVPFARGGSS